MLGLLRLTALIRSRVAFLPEQMSATSTDTLCRCRRLTASPGLRAHDSSVSAFEMLLLSFALADRIKAERQAREHAVSMGLREQVKKDEAERVSREKSRFLAA